VRGVTAIYLRVYFWPTLALRRCVQYSVSGCLLSEMPLPDAINYLQSNSSFLHLVRWSIGSARTNESTALAAWHRPVEAAKVSSFMLRRNRRPHRVVR